MNNPNTLTRDTWPPNPLTMPTDEVSYHLYKANSHAHTASVEVDDFNHAMNMGELAHAIASAEILMSSYETVLASLVRYAITSGTMTERDIEDATATLTRGRIKTMAKQDGGWSKVAPTIDALKDMIDAMRNNEE